MNKAKVVALSVLIGIPSLFTVISMITSNWMFLLVSIPPSIIAGSIGLFVSRQKQVNSRT